MKFEGKKIYKIYKKKKKKKTLRAIACGATLDV